MRCVINFSLSIHFTVSKPRTRAVRAQHTVMIPGTMTPTYARTHTRTLTTTRIVIAILAIKRKKALYSS